MKKRIIFFILAFLCAYASSSFAQMNSGLFGNEWINYQQTYYKMKVTEDGLHRVPSQYLQQSGIDVSQLTASNVQIFHQGQEIPVHVHLNAGTVDYIEFYGKKNRGDLDVNLYANPNHHLNPEYSLITDTAAYFLTYNNANNGRRYTTASANLTNLPAKEDYYIHRSLATPTLVWQPGKEYNISGDVLSKSTFEYGEGWGSAKTSNQSLQVSTPYVYIGGPLATVSARLYSEGNTGHNLQIQVSNITAYSSSFWGDSVNTHSFSIAQNQLGTPTVINVLGVNGAYDRHSVGYIAIEYPRLFDFEGKTVFAFKVGASTTRKYLEICNFSNPAGTQNIYLYDMTNGQRIHCFWDGSRVLTDLSPSASTRELLLVNLDDVNACKTIGRLEAVTFTNYAPLNADYIMIAHKNMFVDDQGQNPALEYAAYRAANGYNPVVVDVQQIFDQFGYGLDMHPQAMRNFAAFVKQRWTNPKYIFLIGKARPYNAIRSYNTYDCLVPTFGTPPSDNLMFAAPGTLLPAIPVGRLSVVDGNGLRSYFNKVKDMELLATSQSPANKGWEKNIVHLGGGANEGEQVLFSNVLNSLIPTIEGGSYGGKVHSFFKKMNEPTQAGRSANLDSLINNGVSIITYLGHATSSSFDFNAYLLQSYNNYRKYPLFLSLSCSNGNIFNQNEEMSESFVLSPNSGAIAFVGFSQPVSLSSANLFSSEFYRLLSNEGYGDGAGNITKGALGYLNNYVQNSIVIELAMNYLIYHGDPALKLHANNGSDYTVDASSIRTEPSVITAQVESFDLVFDLYNLGKAIDTTFRMDVYRKFPNGDTVLVSSKNVTTPSNKETMHVKVPVGGVRGAGVNEFFIKLDVNNTIAELPNPAAEANNNSSFSVQIMHSLVTPVFPAEFAMLPTTDITLMASTGDAFAPTKTYLFEIDTTANFDSPMLHSTQVTQSGGLLTWHPDMAYLDTTVYYWRVTPDDETMLGVNNSRNVSSFMFNLGQSGWNQSHIYQFKKDEFQSIYLNESQRKFDYVSNLQEISVINGFTPTALGPGYLATFFNNNLTDKCRCQSKNGVYVQVVNPSDFSIWTMPGFSQKYGAINCDDAGRPASVFLFETIFPNKRTALENFLRDSIPADHYVMVYTLNNADATNWSNSLLTLFENLGSTQVRNLASHNTGMPWAFFYQQGHPDYEHHAEKLALSQNEIINLSGLMKDSWYKGNVKSTIIGPAKEWAFLDWVQNDLNNSTEAKGAVDVYGIDNDGNASMLLSDFLRSDTTLVGIDAAQYPYLQLVWNSADSINKTPPQLNHWRVSADFVAELALRPDLYQMGHKTNLMQGDTFHFSVMMHNIGDVDVDSILVKYSLQGSNQPMYKRIAALHAGDTMRTPIFSLPTNSLTGMQQLLVEINADKEQSEMYYFNNTALTQFFVKEKAFDRDNITPAPITRSQSSVLARFDGRQINNGAVVPAQLNVNLDSKMINPAMVVTEFEELLLVLKHPNMENGFMMLNRNNPIVKRLNFSANRIGDTCHVMIDMDLDLPWNDGYTFEFSCNSNMLKKYTIGFKVEDNEVSAVAYNYPNPFSTETRFSFQVENNADIDLKTVGIQISDINGRVVKVIDPSQLGEIKVGANQPSFAWDGTDMAGALLPSGVYFYNVVAKMVDGTSKNISKPGTMRFTR